jgi:hypothetical protein
MRSAAMSLLTAVLLAVPWGAHAEDYWSYQYKYLDVVAAGTSQYAVNLAHNVDRLDRALRQILPLMAQKPVATHIYVLTGSDLRPLGMAAGESRFSSNGDATTVIATASEAPYQYWGAYFGYTGGLLRSNGPRRYPYWFYMGVPQVFADTDFRGDTIRTGGLAHGWGSVITRGSALLPMSTFLTLKARDVAGLPQSQSQLFEAESWYVAREFLVEGKYRTELTQYLTAMAGGTAEADAFAASFKMSHEQLDKVLAQVMYDRAHIYILDVPDERSDDGTPPRQLGAAELKSLLEALAAQDASPATH